MKLNNGPGTVVSFRISPESSPCQPIEARCGSGLTASNTQGGSLGKNLLLCRWGFPAETEGTLSNPSWGPWLPCLQCVCVPQDILPLPLFSPLASLLFLHSCESPRQSWISVMGLCMCLHALKCHLPLGHGSFPKCILDKAPDFPGSPFSPLAIPRDPS